MDWIPHAVRSTPLAIPPAEYLTFGLPPAVALPSTFLDSNSHGSPLLLVSPFNSMLRIGVEIVSMAMSPSAPAPCQAFSFVFEPRSSRFNGGTSAAGVADRSPPGDQLGSRLPELCLQHVPGIPGCMPVCIPVMAIWDPLLRAFHSLRLLRTPSSSRGRHWSPVRQTGTAPRHCTF